MYKENWTHKGYCGSGTTVKVKYIKFSFVIYWYMITKSKLIGYNDYKQRIIDHERLFIDERR